MQATRKRIRESIHRVDPSGVESRREAATRRIRRRVYFSPHPLHTWHLDGNHKLIRWRIVIHAGIDGFTRLCLYLCASDNNRADTVVHHFADTAEVVGSSPTRIRTDNGVENTKVWDAMYQFTGPDSVITGSSVHNQRVERFNREINRHVREKYASIFYDLENTGQLNVDDRFDIFSLHFIFIPHINIQLAALQDSHNNHPIQTANNRSPIQMLALER